MRHVSGVLRLHDDHGRLNNHDNNENAKADGGLHLRRIHLQIYRLSITWKTK